MRTAVNSIFLCNEHSDYEIYEGMARIFGSSDEQQVNFYKSILEENKLHPFIFERKTSPLSLGGIDYSLFRASGDANGHLINEIKLMVPCSEVLVAEKIIDEVKKQMNQHQQMIIYDISIINCHFSVNDSMRNLQFLSIRFLSDE